MSEVAWKGGIDEVIPPCFFMSKKQKIQPEKVNRIFCPKCGDLMVKIYPWSSLKVPPGTQLSPCGKCVNKQ